jgi:hypothetical protein
MPGWLWINRLSSAWGKNQSSLALRAIALAA